MFTTEQKGYTRDATPPAVTYLKNYGTRFGVVENNLLSAATARAMFDRGDNLAILVGPHDNPTHAIQIFKRHDTGERRLDVDFFSDLRKESVYITLTNGAKGDVNALFLAKYVAYQGPERDRTFILFVNDANTEGGDLPRLSFDHIAGPDIHAVSVPPKDFDLGPFPTFDDLISGRFVRSLPKITIPPKHLWDRYIPQDVRTAQTPKRIPIGRFPW